MVLQMFGSIAGAESLLIALDEEERPQTVMAEAPHGTAPSLEGKNVANPIAMILAGAALLTFFHAEEASLVSRAVYEATFETVLDGTRTADLGGATGTTEFTDEVIRHVRNKLEVWSALA
jgi:isocitrate/isopropylmalate dehydrogenase